MISFERVDSLISYDPETGVFLWKISRGRSRSGSKAGFSDTSGYFLIQIDEIQYRAHRVAHLLMTGHWPEGEPDHENLNKADNRWMNICDLATASEQGGHRGIFRNNTSGLKGIGWHTRSGKWQARIKVRGRLIHLGLFDDLRLGGLTYDAAAKIVWGIRFSCLNFPPEDSDHIILNKRIMECLRS